MIIVNKLFLYEFFVDSTSLNKPFLVVKLLLGVIDQSFNWSVE